MSRQRLVEVTTELTEASSARVDALLERLRRDQPGSRHLTREELLQVLILRGMDSLEAALERQRS